ncbi:hypothetical protein STAS_02108 [Striga asiatica]|uniref:Membrane-associated kinase regulator 6 n=1 Tax=Striga asiatica TaxID=4170 RepID=A0A5A7P0Y8_STRAF|nr:hypothetical protein STAS_02108 [Striga asiatica]
MEKENFQPLATESFSYSWLTHKNPASSLDTFLGSKFASTNSEKQISFDFDFSITTSSSPTSCLIHADELFSDGQIKPVYMEKSQPEAQKTSNIISTPPTPLYSPISPFVTENNRHTLGKWRKSSQKILQKCIGFVRPLCKMSSRKSNRVDDLDRKVSEVKSWNNSCEASPRPSSAYSVFEWADVEKIEKKIDFFHRLKKAKSGKISPRASPNISPSRSSNVWFDADNSINEAILYCKRSIAIKFLPIA